MHVYKAFNNAMPTTAAQLKVTTGTTIKTMLQIASPASRQLQVLAWGFSVDGGASSAARVELLDTDVAATVTAHVASGVQPITPGAPASLVTLGTSATGYTGTAEGSITATRSHGYYELPAGTLNGDCNFSYQFMPDERPIIAVSRFLRVRATFAVAASMVCWVVWTE
jgi:hypothetical protein